MYNNANSNTPKPQKFIILISVKGRNVGSTCTFMSLIQFVEF